MERKWSLENCKNEALKYNSRTEFCTINHSCYSMCSRNKWLDIVCIHMKPTKKSRTLIGLRILLIPAMLINRILGSIISSIKLTRIKL